MAAASAPPAADASRERPRTLEKGRRPVRGSLGPQAPACPLDELKCAPGRSAVRSRKRPGEHSRRQQPLTRSARATTACLRAGRTDPRPARAVRVATACIVPVLLREGMAPESRAQGPRRALLMTEPDWHQNLTAHRA